MKVTVFTPTYNRADLLPVLYKSLVAQTSKDFEWIVVNDGDSDNTKQLLTEWENSKTIAIKVIHTANGGKQ
jgi:glycosyltransferase involved in cell wall biosynthesis